MKIFTYLVLTLFAQQTIAQMVVQNGATVVTNGNAVICLLNTDLQNNGIINQLSGTGKFVFNGNANSTISGTNMPNFAVLEIAKTGAASLLLQQNIGINENLLFTTGLINLNNRNVLLQPTALLIGESENSRITTNTGGYVEITNSLNAPTAVNMGNLGAVISSAQNLGSTIIRRGHVSQVVASGGSSVHRYYDILPANNLALNARLRINYFDTELNAQTETGLVLYKSTDNITWSNMSFTTRDAGLNFVERTGLSDFSRWTLSSFGTALPVSFINFSVACNNGAAILTWKTAQEINSKHFNVQMSTNGVSWQTIATVQAAGNSSTEKQYSFTNNNQTSASTFYRLLQEDIDGRSANSVVVRSNCDVPTTDNVQVFPNPVTDKAWININANAASLMQIRLMDEKGSLVHLQTAAIVKGNNRVAITLPYISNGSYFLHLVWNNGASQKTVKMVKL